VVSGTNAVLAVAAQNAPIIRGANAVGAGADENNFTERYQSTHY
jgi:hypothetical protein